MRDEIYCLIENPSEVRFVRYLNFKRIDEKDSQMKPTKKKESPKKMKEMPKKEKKKEMSHVSEKRIKDYGKKK